MTRYSFLFFLLSVSLFYAHAQMVPPVSTPEPDVRIIFSRIQAFPFASDAPILSNIYSVDSGGSFETQLTDDNHSFTPFPSPDGSKIAFVHVDPDTCENCILPARHQLFVMNSDGSDARSLAKLQTLFTLVAWAPDGSSLTYSDRVPSSANSGADLGIYL